MATKLKALPVPLAPLSDQLAIASHLSVMDARLAAEEAGCAALESLLRNLMTGKVRLKHFVEQLDPEATR